jgi:hypothetical protein
LAPLIPFVFLLVPIAVVDLVPLVCQAAHVVCFFQQPLLLFGFLLDDSSFFFNFLGPVTESDQEALSNATGTSLVSVSKWVTTRP